MKKALVILLFLMILCGCEAKPLPSFGNDYPSMQTIDHVYEKVNFTTALNLLLENTGVLVIGYNQKNPVNDKYTSEIIPILNEVAITVEYEQIYYLDLYDMKAENSTEYRLLLAYLEYTVGDLLTIDEEKVIFTPDVYFVHEGNIVGHHIGTIQNENGSFIEDLNEEQIEALKVIYHNLFIRLQAHNGDE